MPITAKHFVKHARRPMFLGIEETSLNPKLKPYEIPDQGKSICKSRRKCLSHSAGVAAGLVWLQESGLKFT